MVPKQFLYAVPRDSQLISMALGLYDVVNLTPQATSWANVTVSIKSDLSVC